MKKTHFLFSLLALLFFSATASYGQSLDIQNKSNCTVAIQLSASQNNCHYSCQTNLLFLAPNSSATIALPPCSISGMIPYTFYRIDLTDGTNTATVGLNCGLSPSATYTDCEGTSRTLIMNSAISASIY